MSKQKFILIDVYENTVIKNFYNNLNEAIDDLEAEFYCYTSEENGLAYGNECWIDENSKQAWAKVNGNYRTWFIMQVK